MFIDVKCLGENRPYRVIKKMPEVIYNFTFPSDYIENWAVELSEDMKVKSILVRSGSFVVFHPTLVKAHFYLSHRYHMYFDFDGYTSSTVHTDFPADMPPTKCDFNIWVSETIELLWQEAQVKLVL